MNRNPPTNNNGPADSVSANQFLEMTDHEFRPKPQAYDEHLEDGHSACSRQPSHGSDGVETASSCLISGALSQLPCRDREKALNEMHGVDEPREEAPEFVENMISELKQQLRLYLQRRCDPRVEAFALAAVQNPDFAFHRESCERFLRSSGYNVSKAACSIIRYYNWKRQFFGEKKLIKEIECSASGSNTVSLLANPSDSKPMRRRVVFFGTRFKFDWIREPNRWLYG